MKEFLTAKEVSKLFQIHLHTVYRMVWLKMIPFIRKRGVGLRFDREALEAWIKEGRIEPKDQGNNGTRSH